MSRELDEAMELMHFAWRRVISEPDRELEERGFGRLHHRILYVIGQNPRLAMGELTELLGVSKQAIHVPVKDLTDAGLLTIVRAASDRRIKMLDLTEDGTRYERRLARAEHRVLGEAFARAGPEAVAGWRVVMDALALGRRLRLGRPGDELER